MGFSKAELSHELGYVISCVGNIMEEKSFV
jgi:hypothetical protein